MQNSLTLINPGSQHIGRKLKNRKNRGCIKPASGTQEPDAGKLTPAKPLRPQIVISFFVIVLLARLVFVHHYASPGLTFDQWNGVVQRQFIPWTDHSWTFASLFEGDNGHRVVWQRIWDFGLLKLLGTYDNRAWCFANTFLYAAVITVLFWMFAREADSITRRWLGAACLALGCLPFASENALVGFQSQSWFFMVSAGLACWFYSRAKTALCVLCCCATLFANAGGLFVPLAILLVNLWRGQWWSKMSIGLFAVFVVGLVLLLTPSYSPAPEAVKLEGSRNIGMFICALGRCLGWPWTTEPWAAAIVLAPIVWLTWSQRQVLSSAGLFIVSMAAWIVIEAAAVSFGRGSVQSGPVPYLRYQDWLALLLPLGIGAFATLKLPIQCRFWPAIWGTAMAIGLVIHTERDFMFVLPNEVALDKVWYQNTAYLYQTGDCAAFQGKPDWMLPWPPATQFLAFLRSDGVRKVLNPATFKLKPNP